MNECTIALNATRGCILHVYLAFLPGNLQSHKCLETSIYTRTLVSSTVDETTRTLCAPVYRSASEQSPRNEGEKWLLHLRVWRLE